MSDLIRVSGITVNSNKLDSNDGSYYINNDNLLDKIKGVDGHSSGIDADLLDGIESSKFLFGSNERAVLTTESINTITKSGLYTSRDSANNPNKASVFILLHIAKDVDDSAAWQLGVVAGSNVIYSRSKSTTWSDWSNLWGSNNDSHLSGLDADKVDGYDSNSMLLNRDAISSTNLDSLKTPGSYRISYGSNYSTTILVFGSESGSTTVVQVEYCFSGLVNGIRYPRFRNLTDGSTWTNWKTLWSDENDGHNSGLDADLLDGKHGSEYLTRYDNSIPGLNTYYNWGGFYSSATSNVGYIKITLPRNANIMLNSRISLRSYNYLGQIILGGYTYIAGNEWHHPQVTGNITGTGQSKSLNIRFVSEGTNRYILLGDSNTDWGGYLHFNIDEITIGYGNSSTTPIGRLDSELVTSYTGSLNYIYTLSTPWSLQNQGPGSGLITDKVASLSSDPASPVIGQIWIKS